MTDKRSKYDTDPLDPDFVRRTEENLWGAARAPHAEETDQLLRDPAAEEQPTRRFDEQMADTYPSVFVPPAYQPPRAPQAQPFTTFGAGPHQPPATTSAPPPGPSSPYPNPYQSYTGPTSRPVARLGIPEKFAVILPYFPAYIGLVAALVELAMVPRGETRVRFHAAQGLALQFAMLAISLMLSVIGGITGSRFGGTLFWLASFIFLIVSIVRVWKGETHHIAPLDEPANWLSQHIEPRK